METLVEALKRPQAWPGEEGPVEHIETHISHLFLVGDHAYKVKKPLNLGFLDFSTLERRRHCCEEEVRLNGRTAPGLYLGVVPIARENGGYRVEGPGPAVEWAVKMRRFDQAGLFDRLALTDALIDAVADKVAAFHESLPPAPDEAAWGRPDQVWFPMNQNFEQILALGVFPSHEGRLRALWDQARGRFQALEALVAERRGEGFTRECHGDLHLGNIALVEGQVMLFDGIEFNPDLRWIDVANDIAFLVMDLTMRGHEPLAWRFLNRYLEITGDYEGVPLLPLYAAYRAMVRAKVAAIRLAQAGADSAEAQALADEFEAYLTLAERYLATPGQVPLAITHGLSGSGKSRLARGLAQRAGLIHLGSDVERKRIHGLAPLEKSDSGLESGLYTAEATERTYARLAGLAELLTGAGQGVVVDATFADPVQRARFKEIARRTGARWIILDLQAPPEVLRARVAERARRGDDPSEAGPEVLEHQLARWAPLADEERSAAWFVDAGKDFDLEELSAKLADPRKV